jgi:hypothetical protein
VYYCAAVSHEKGKITVLQLSALLKQADSSKRKLTLTRLASAPIPFTVLSITGNQWNEDFLAVCGLKVSYWIHLNIKFVPRFGSLLKELNASDWKKKILTLYEWTLWKGFPSFSFYVAVGLERETDSCKISGFCYSVVKVFALLGFYAA